MQSEPILFPTVTLLLATVTPPTVKVAVVVALIPPAVMPALTWIG